jgi:hypothetical protein
MIAVRNGQTRRGEREHDAALVSCAYKKPGRERQRARCERFYVTIPAARAMASIERSWRPSENYPAAFHFLKPWSTLEIWK